MKLKFWRKSEPSLNKTESTSTTREVHDVAVIYVEGFGGQKQIHVTGWNTSDVFELFQKVNNEVKKK